MIIGLRKKETNVNKYVVFIIVDKVYKFSYTQYPSRQDNDTPKYPRETSGSNIDWYINEKGYTKLTHHRAMPIHVWRFAEDFLARQVAAVSKSAYRDASYQV